MPSPFGPGAFEIVDPVPFVPKSQKRRMAEHFMGINPDAKWTLHVQGSCVVVKHRLGVPFPIETPIRRPVTEFTKASRMRLLRCLNRINWKNIDKSLFITLTYPDTIEYLKYKNRNKHRGIFLRSLEAYFGTKIGTIWRCEWKERLSGARKGRLAPHLHMIVFGQQYIHHAKVMKMWAKAIGHKGRVSTHVALITGHQGALKYLAKYVSKEHYLDIGAYLNNGVQIGRHWGMSRRSVIPWGKVEFNGEITTDEAQALQTVEESVNQQYDPALGAGFTLLGDDAKKAILRAMGKKC